MKTLAVFALLSISALGFSLASYFAYDWLWGVDYQLRAAEQAMEHRDFLEAEARINRCLDGRPSKPEVQFLAARIKRRAIFPILPGGVDGPGACLTAGSVRYDGSYDDAEHHLFKYGELGGLIELINLEQNLLRAQRGELEMVVRSDSGPTTVERMLQSWIQDNHPDTPLILEALVKAYLQAYRLAEALQCVNTWLQRQEDTQALLWRAWILKRLGDDAAALKDYRQVLEEHPEQDNVRQRVAEMLLHSSGPAEAVEHFEVLWQRKVRNPALMLGLAQCRKGLGASDEARQLLDDLLSEHPDYLPALIERGKLALDEQKLDEAERLFRSAVQVAPYDALANYNLYLCVLRRGNKEEARELAAKRARIEKDMSRMDELGREIALKPHEASLRCEAGTILLRNGLKEDGRRWLLSALREEPYHAPTRAALAEYFEKEGNPSLAALHRRIADAQGTDSGQSSSAKKP